MTLNEQATRKRLIDHALSRAGSVSRKNNYESNLTIVYDCLQEKSSSIEFIFGGLQNSWKIHAGTVQLRSAALAPVQEPVCDGGNPEFLRSVSGASTSDERKNYVLHHKIRDIYIGAISSQIRTNDTAIQAFILHSNLSRPRGTERSCISLDS